jgi:hypothetical protein
MMPVAVIVSILLLVKHLDRLYSLLGDNKGRTVYKREAV